MKLNHLDLQVTSIHAAQAFFETHFGLRCTYTRSTQIAIMEDDYGFILGLSNLTGQDTVPVYPPDFHVGFVLENTALVEAMYGRLQSAGVPMKNHLREGGPALYFTCLAPDAIPVEVSAIRK